MNSDQSVSEPTEIRLKVESYNQYIYYQKVKSTIIFFRWLVNDGEYIEVGQPIFDFQMRPDIRGYGITTFTYVSDFEGVLSQSMLKEKDEMNIDELLFTIYPKGLYINENVVENETYKFYLNNHKLKKIALKSGATVHKNHGLSPFTVSRELEDGSYVKEDEHVITIINRDINRDNHNESYRILANRAGYINYTELSIDTIFLDNSDQLVYKISNTDQERIDEKYFIVPQITFDEFSQSKIIKWEKVSGYNGFVKSTATSGNVTLGISFQYDSRDYIVFSFENKELILSQNDKISFLFENGSIIDFTLSQNSYRSTEQGNKSFENRVPISDVEILLFVNENFKFWKIKFEKTGREIIGGNKGFGNYEYKSNLQIVIKKLAAGYRSLVREQINNYSPFLDEMKPKEAEVNLHSEICFVYLMVDRVNDIHKIGISNNPSWREKTLQSEKPTIELLVAKKFVNRKIASSFEKALHDAYAPKRIRGEWFQLDAIDLSEITETLNS